MRLIRSLAPHRAVREHAQRRAGARAAGPAPDAGFTLVEVMVALVLLSIVLVAAGGFMIKAMSSSSELSGRQGAVTVANQVMERVRAVNPTFDKAGISPLVYGRGQAASTALWTVAAAAGLDVGNTYTGDGLTAYDAATYASSGVLNVPLDQNVQQGSQLYRVRTLIGTCVAVKTVTSVLSPTVTNPCTRGLIGYELFRVIVWVTWTPASGSCSGTSCSFTSSTLIDPTTDPVFNTNRKPVANPDTATVVSGGSVQVGVTANDSGVFPLTGAVTIVAQPGHGTATITAGTNIVTYSSTAGYSGTDTFSYTVTDTTGLTSTVTTDTITVTPVGVNDTLSTTARATATTVNVLGNDLGSGLRLTSITAPALGTATISGNGISYMPPTTASGITTITYTAQDSSGQAETATLTVAVKPYVPGNQCTSFLTVGLYSFTPLATGTGPFTIQIVSVTGATIPPVISGTGVSLSGLYLGEKITFTVTDADGVVSDQQTVTVGLLIC